MLRNDHRSVYLFTTVRVTDLCQENRLWKLFHCQIRNSRARYERNRTYSNNWNDGDHSPTWYLPSRRKQPLRIANSNVGSDCYVRGWNSKSTFTVHGFELRLAYLATKNFCYSRRSTGALFDEKIQKRYRWTSRFDSNETTIVVQLRHRCCNNEFTRFQRRTDRFCRISFRNADPGSLSLTSIHESISWNVICIRLRWSFSFYSLCTYIWSSLRLQGGTQQVTGLHFQDSIVLTFVHECFDREFKFSSICFTFDVFNESYSFEISGKLNIV